MGCQMEVVLCGIEDLWERWVTKYYIVNLVSYSRLVLYYAFTAKKTSNKSLFSVVSPKVRKNLALPLDILDILVMLYLIIVI